MKMQLATPIAKYFAADRGDANAVADCFTENAVVVDESHTYTGRDAIRRWNEAATMQYNDGDRIASLEIVAPR
jgi:ketosteroid isomerase-like protein